MEHRFAVVSNGCTPPFTTSECRVKKQGVKAEENEQRKSMLLGGETRPN